MTKLLLKSGMALTDQVNQKIPPDHDGAFPMLTVVQVSFLSVCFVFMPLNIEQNLPKLRQFHHQNLKELPSTMLSYIVDLHEVSFGSNIQ